MAGPSPPTDPKDRQQAFRTLSRAGFDATRNLLRNKVAHRQNISFTHMGQVSYRSSCTHCNNKQNLMQQNILDTPSSIYKKDVRNQTQMLSRKASTVLLQVKLNWIKDDQLWGFFVGEYSLSDFSHAQRK